MFIFLLSSEAVGPQFLGPRHLELSLIHVDLIVSDRLASPAEAPEKVGL